MMEWMAEWKQHRKMEKNNLLMITMAIYFIERAEHQSDIKMSEQQMTPRFAT